MTKTRSLQRVAGLIAGVALVMGTSLLAQPAMADDGGSSDRHLTLTWSDGGTPGSATETFFGSSVSVPGDRSARTVTVTNDGPGDGVLQAVITDVLLASPDAPDVHHNTAHRAPGGPGYEGSGDQGNFYDDVTVAWAGGEATLAELLAQGETDVLEVPLKRGEAATLTLTYEYATGAASGNRANIEPRSASFDVLFTLSGDTSTVTPTPNPKPKPPLVMTGGAVPVWLIVAAAGLIAAGATFVGARRARQNAE